MREPALRQILERSPVRTSDDMVLREARRGEATQDGDKTARAPMEEAAG